MKDGPPIKQRKEYFCEGSFHAHGAKNKRAGKDESRYVSPKIHVRLWRKMTIHDPIEDDSQGP